LIKKIKRIIWYLFVSSLLYVVILRFVFPPITITQFTNAFGLGLKRDYIAWEQLSYNIKLAAIASEDQAFPDHIGVDWEAMERSFKTKKKKKKSRIPL
jgi:monofunctional biosynthetic peptidoglycan transglycosylase